MRAAVINVTPLIDVMLVLLIIFMVVTPLSNHALDAGLPAPARGPSDEHRLMPSLVVEMEPDGCAVVGEPRGTPAMLEARLRDLIAMRSNKTVFVRASALVPYGQVITGLDAVRGAGADRIGLLGREAATH
jgi:biopolymer transport protein TolR